MNSSLADPGVFAVLKARDCFLKQKQIMLPPAFPDATPPPFHPFVTCECWLSSQVPFSGKNQKQDDSIHSTSWLLDHVCR